MGHALRKAKRLERLKTYLMSHEEVHWDDLVAFNKVHHTTTYRDLVELGALNTRKGWYSLMPSAADLALVEAVQRTAPGGRPRAEVEHEYDDPRGLFERRCWCGRTFRTDNERLVYGGEKCQKAAQNARAHAKRKQRKEGV